MAYIGENCSLGDGCKIHPQVFLGDNSKVGKIPLLTRTLPIYHECIIGDSCIIHAGTVIGSDGFGFAPQSETEFMKIPQIEMLSLRTTWRSEQTSELIVQQWVRQLSGRSENR